jgi:cytoskeletal protein RodZ
MDIGGELRTARQARSLSIADIARDTKISARILRAIEANAFDTVPRGPFMRGYLTAYARHVGLDGEDLVRRYRAEFDTPRPLPFSDAAVLTPEEPIDPADGSILSSQSERLQVALIVVVVAAVVYLGTQRQPSAAPGVGVPAADAVQAVTTPAPSAPAAALAREAAPALREVPVGTSGTPQASAAPLTIEVLATGLCWVEASADNSRIVARLMNAGDRQTIPLNGRVRLRVGEPATFSFTINGAAGRPLGAAGRPVTVRIEPGNIDRLLAR